MIAASPRMEKLTCRLLAPSARNKASSRTRWATSIWNVLAMMNAPTKTAMKPKTSKNGLQESQALLDLIRGLFRGRLAGDRLEPRQAGVIQRGLHPLGEHGVGDAVVAGGDRRTRTGLGRLKTRWAVGRSKAVRVAPANESALPKRKMPVIV